MWWISIFLLLFSGCAIKSINKQTSIDDMTIVKALVYEEDGNYKGAIDIYERLYNKTKEQIFLEKIVQNLFYLKKYKEVISYTTGCNLNFNKTLCKYRILSFIQLNRFQKAKKELLSLSHRDEFFYKVMAYIEIQNGNLKVAADYLKSLYALKKDKKTLLKVVDLLIEIKEYNEAIAYLRTAIEEECDIDVCKRLAIIYRQLYDFSSLAKLYEKMGVYSDSFYLKALKIYLINKEYTKASSLIKKYNLDKKYLLLVYEKEGNLQKAKELAFLLYKERGNILYLKKYVVYTYTLSPTKKVAKEIIPYLKKIVNTSPSPFFYNFLGYLLIKYELDVKSGIEYVKRALKSHSLDEYKDSLAWGYYKLGECKKAFEIIKDVKLDDKEIKEHKKAIKKCLKEKNDTSKDNR